MAFKMKGSPFQRNFGIGSPLHHDIIKKQKTKYDKEGNILKQKTKYVKHKHDETNPDPDNIEVKKKVEVKEGKKKKNTTEGVKKVEEKKPESALPPKSEWPPVNTQERRDFYKKHNLKLDNTTEITPDSQAQREEEEDNAGSIIDRLFPRRSR